MEPKIILYEKCKKCKRPIPVTYTRKQFKKLKLLSKRQVKPFFCGLCKAEQNKFTDFVDKIKESGEK